MCAHLLSQWNYPGMYNPCDNMNRRSKTFISLVILILAFGIAYWFSAGMRQTYAAPEESCNWCRAVGCIGGNKVCARYICNNVLVECYTGQL